MTFLRLLPFVFILTFIAGIILAISGWDDVEEAQASESWTTTEGRVTYSQLDAKTLTRRIGSGTVHTNLLFRADIRYEYSVAGTSYSGTDVTIERIWTQDKAVAKSTLQRYPIGARVTVYYDPSTPRRSVLEPGMKGGWPAQIELGVIFCVVSLIGFAIASYLKRSGS